MERFILFAGSTFYPCGGAEDIFTSSDSIILITIAVQNYSEAKAFDWYHVLDTETGHHTVIEDNPY